MLHHRFTFYAEAAPSFSESPYRDDYVSGGALLHEEHRARFHLIASLQAVEVDAVGERSGGNAPALPAVARNDSFCLSL